MLLVVLLFYFRLTTQGFGFAGQQVAAGVLAEVRPQEEQSTCPSRAGLFGRSEPVCSLFSANNSRFSCRRPHSLGEAHDRPRSRQSRRHRQRSFYSWFEIDPGWPCIHIPAHRTLPHRRVNWQEEGHRAAGRGFTDTAIYASLLEIVALKLLLRRRDCHQCFQG